MIFFFHDLVQLLFKTKPLASAVFCHLRMWCVRNIPLHLVWALLLSCDAAFPVCRLQLTPHCTDLCPIISLHSFFLIWNVTPYLWTTLSAFSASFLVLWRPPWGWSSRNPWSPIAAHSLDSVCTSVLRRCLWAQPVSDRTLFSVLVTQLDRTGSPLMPAWGLTSSTCSRSRTLLCRLLTLACNQKTSLSYPSGCLPKKRHGWTSWCSFLLYWLWKTGTPARWDKYMATEAFHVPQIALGLQLCMSCNKDSEQ